MSAPHLLPQHPMHVPFRSAPVTHAPSPFGFGFGLSNQASTSTAMPQYNHLSSSTLHQGYQPQQSHSIVPHSPFAGLVQPYSHARAAGTSPARPNAKRRHDDTDIGENREDSNMNTRSPSPDRPRRIVAKRLRATDVEREAASKTAEDSQANVDVGVLLASLPSESLLPLLTSLIASQPTLKPIVLSLIPKPSVEAAIHALNNSAKTLRDAYPYAQSTQPASTTFGFGSTFGTSMSMHAPSTSFGFRPTGTANTNGVMRDDYIRNRIRPSVTEFISTATSYLSYFSLLPSPQNPNPQYSRASLHDSFTYLCALSAHVMRAPPLARVLLLENAVLFPKVSAEWNVWIDRLDIEVNQNGGMFSGEAVREWERSLDELAKEGAAVGQTGNMRPIRDKWIEKVGWMVGRTVPKDLGLLNMAEEDEEL